MGDDPQLPSDSRSSGQSRSLTDQWQMSSSSCGWMDRNLVFKPLKRLPTFQLLLLSLSYNIQNYPHQSMWDKGISYNQIYILDWSHIERTSKYLTVENVRGQALVRMGRWFSLASFGVLLGSTNCTVISGRFNSSPTICGRSWFNKLSFSWLFEKKKWDMKYMIYNVWC